MLELARYAVVVPALDQNTAAVPALVLLLVQTRRWSGKNTVRCVKLNIERDPRSCLHSPNLTSVSLD